MSDEKAKLLALVPQAPPHGGVAAQAALLLASKAFRAAFEPAVIRTNAFRPAENPDRKRLDIRSMTGALKLMVATANAVRRAEYSAVYCIANGDLSFPWVMLCALHAARLRGCPLILHVHASRSGFWEWQKQHVSDCRSNACALRKSISGMGDRICARLSWRASRLVHLTAGIDERYRALGWRPADLVLPNSTAVQAAVDPLLKEPGSMLFLGRLSREKGLFDLLEALSGLGAAAGNWKLHVAGSVPAGENPGAVESAVSTGGFGDRIVLHGLVMGEEKAGLLASCSILVQPTHRDVFPMAVVEAMASGLAVISTGVGEIPSIPSEAGWAMAEAGDPSSLRGAVSGLLSDPQSVLRMGKANREKALREYDVEVNAGRLVDLISGSIREVHR
jgi:glycosyltransferase involved in cell wall biosynthesis